ncbi:MAG TPA: WD40 repeat domain-containing protein, partial [Gemmataceae bacterium]|nr:WD40 repeat domain-containing protein [Gemmataceae bacterium]
GANGPGLRVGQPADVALPAVKGFLPRGSLAVSSDGRFVALAGAVSRPVPKSLLKGESTDPGPDQRLFRPAFVTTPLADFRAGKWSGYLTVMYPMGLVHTDPPPKLFGLNRLALSPAGHWLAAAKPDVTIPSRTEPANGVFWDLSGASPRASDVRYADGLPRHLAFSPDGRWLVEGSRTEHRVRTPGTWEVVCQFPGEPTGRRSAPAAFSPDGQLLAVSRSRREVTLVRTGTWEEVATLPLRQDDVLHWMGFTGDGERLVATSATAVHVWDLGRIRAKWRELGVDVE